MMSLGGVIGKTVGTVARMAYPVYNAVQAIRTQHQYVQKNITRSLTENVTTGGIAGAVGALATKSAPGPGGLAGAAAGAAATVGKVIHDSWYETPVVSAVSGAARAIGKEAWRMYRE